MNEDEFIGDVFIPPRVREAIDRQNDEIATFTLLVVLALVAIVALVLWALDALGWVSIPS